jgi:hypothetical protein
MLQLPGRTRLPKPSDRLPLGTSGLMVSPICLGHTSAETVIAAFDAGINFFFVSADAHWPFYAGVRTGLEKLLRDKIAKRSQIVLAIVSYLDNPLFHQTGVFGEVLNAIPASESADVLIAGATTSRNFDRIDTLKKLRAAGRFGSRAIGASFHDRASALTACNEGSLDISYIRYNTDHTGASADLLPHLKPNSSTLVFNFKSAMFPVKDHEFALLPESDRKWLPDICDHYRFVLSHPRIDGVLCSPQSPDELSDLVGALDRKPLDLDEQEYMIRLSSLAHPPDSVPGRVNVWWDRPTEAPSKRLPGPIAHSLSPS